MRAFFNELQLIRIYNQNIINLKLSGGGLRDGGNL